MGATEEKSVRYRELQNSLLSECAGCVNDFYD